MSSPLGGDERCDELNWADNVVQTAGAEGCDTLRLSPVARVEPPPPGGGPPALLGLDELDPLVLPDVELEPFAELAPPPPELLVAEPKELVPLELPPGRALAPLLLPGLVLLDPLELTGAPPLVVEPGPDVLPP